MTALTLVLAAAASVLGLAVVVLAVQLNRARRNERRGWTLADARYFALCAEIRRSQGLAAQLERNRINGKATAALLHKPGGERDA